MNNYILFLISVECIYELTSLISVEFLYELTNVPYTEWMCNWVSEGFVFFRMWAIFLDDAANSNHIVFDFKKSLKIPNA
jgi:hypothetical protein